MSDPCSVNNDGMPKNLQKRICSVNECLLKLKSVETPMGMHPVQTLRNQPFAHKAGPQPVFKLEQRQCIPGDMSVATVGDMDPV